MLRGRVLRHENAGKAMAYMVRRLHTHKAKASIMGFFGLELGTVDWKTGLHYTTALPMLDNGFDED